MNGQKQLFSVLMLFIFILSFCFIKHIMRREKELKRQQEETQRLKLAKERYEMELKRQQMILSRMLEYEKISYDIHAIVFKPEIIDFYYKTILPSDENSDKNDGLLNNDDEDDDSINNNSLNENAKSGKSSSSSNRQQQNRKRRTIDNTKSKNSVVSEPIIYLFILVLLYSLIKAAMDISQHYQKHNNEKDTPGSRRCSLNEYPQQASVKRSTFQSMEIRSKSFSRSIEERRMSRAMGIPDGSNPYGDYIGGGGASSGEGIKGFKPPPLLRRCSVPAFSYGDNLLRRQSVNESMDIKRRVRMIQRH